MAVFLLLSIGDVHLRTTKGPRNEMPKQCSLLCFIPFRPLFVCLEGCQSIK